MPEKDIKIGIAGMGAIGSAVARALMDGIGGYRLSAVSDLRAPEEFDVPCVEFSILAERCDMVIEALPPGEVPGLAQEVFKHGKTLILISPSALLMFPEILDQQKRSASRIIIPSGALCGLDGVSSLKQMGITSAKIATTKKPMGYDGAPYIVENKIDLTAIKQKQKLFSGNALEAAIAFPANINVAATLSFSGIGPKKTQVEVWADPDIAGNTHEIEVIGEFSRISATVQNRPDPNNPKTSMLAAQSIIAILKKLSEPLAVL